VSALDHASLIVVAALMAVILAGIIRHHLFRLCRSFALYVASVGIGSSLIALCPRVFYNWDFWQVKELTYAVIKFLVALEIAALAFQAFPGARARGRQVALLILGATLLAVMLPPPVEAVSRELSPQAMFFLGVQPRLAQGTIMLFAGVWALVLWYVIPLHRWHRAILRGLLPYMLVFTLMIRVVVSFGFHTAKWMGYADSLAYILVLVYWAWEAWRSDPRQPPPEILSRLQPWLDRS
jgi:hypothetical protein